MSKVTDDSPSSVSGLQAGDLVLAVNDLDISTMSQKDASSRIQEGGDKFKITVRRFVVNNQVLLKVSMELL